MYAYRRGCPMPNNAAQFALRFCSWSCLWYVINNGGIRFDLVFCSVVGFIQFLLFAHMMVFGGFDARSWQLYYIVGLSPQYLGPLLENAKLIPDKWQRRLRMYCLIITSSFLSCYEFLEDGTIDQ